ncbi:MAG: hypothetical protein Q9195_007014 [Heterodermia aff. obscurata]
MPSDRVSLSVRPRGKPLKKLPEEISAPYTGKAADLYSELATRSDTSVHRLRIIKGSDGSLVPNSSDVSISQTGLRDQSTVYVKDLGPQIAWRTVFLVEYLGPIIIHPMLLALLPSSPPSTAQILSCLLITLHFVKREVETLFIHRFSAATMPARNIFKNSAHYWLLAGANIAYWIYKPNSPTARLHNPILIYGGLLLYIVGEVGNLSTHITLRNLRSAGGKERGIPSGLGFDLVTCPNYMFETLAWTGILAVTWSLSTLLFVAVAVGQMGVWAGGKEKKYRREFGDKYKKKRSVILPGVW